MSFPVWVTKIGPFTVKRQNWGRWGYAYKGYKPRLVLHTTETIGFPDYGRGGNQPHLSIRLVGSGGLEVRQHQSLNIGARALLGVSTNTANCIQVEQCMYSDRNIAKRVGGQWVGDLSAAQLVTLGTFYEALSDLCGIPPTMRTTKGRMAQSTWLARNGWGVTDHARVPQNSHWDCGVLDIVGALGRVGAGVGSQIGHGGSSKPKPGKYGLTHSEVKSVQRALNDHFGGKLTVDGVYGAKTKAAVAVAQKKLKVTADSIWGGDTQKAYDAWHAKKRKPAPKPKPKPKPKPAKGKLKVDGILGDKSTREMQHQLGTKADGHIDGQNSAHKGNFKRWDTLRFNSAHTGSPMVAALQKKVGAKPDRLLGPATAGDIQRWLNKHGAKLTVDKICGASTNKALQRALNAGKF